MIRRLLTRLTTDVAALRRTIARLEEQNARLREERDEWHRNFESEERAHGRAIGERDRAEEAADALAYAIAPTEVIGEHSNMNDPWSNALAALEGERREHQAEVERLRALAGNTKPTPAEAQLLDVVRANPGALAKEIGRAALIKGGPPDWIRNATDRDTWPWDGHIADACRPLTSLHRKGLVRRERDGQTYRYWPTEPA